MGKILDEQSLRNHLEDILDGEYALSGGSDQILIEEKLTPSEDFAPFCTHGLADIRIIVFGLVPVAAMVRVPTERSGGKANLAQG